MVTTRFAPSPTGYLHIGNARTALINFLFAKKNGGKFILRIDDTDKEKVKSEYIKGVYDDLSWLGIEFDYVFQQSKRGEIYSKMTQVLIDHGLLYPCFELEEELQIKRENAKKNNIPFIYDRYSLSLSQDEIKKLSSEKKPHYRFKLNPGEIRWKDMIRGDISYQMSNLSDPVVIRSDEAVTYILASVIDDILMNITHIIRGEDHITNTSIQINMFEAISRILTKDQILLDELRILNNKHDAGHKVESKSIEQNKQDSKPIGTLVFGHLSLIKSKDAKISKRAGGFSIESIRRDLGVNSMAVKSFLMLVGTSKNLVVCLDNKELIDKFDIGSYSKSSFEYSENEIIALNKKLIPSLSYSFISSKYPNITKKFWDTVKFNLERESDLESWHKIIFDPCIKKIEDSKALEIATLILEFFEKYTNMQGLNPSPYSQDNDKLDVAKIDHEFTNLKSFNSSNNANIDDNDISEEETKFILRDMVNYVTTKINQIQSQNQSQGQFPGYSQVQSQGHPQNNSQDHFQVQFEDQAQSRVQSQTQGQIHNQIQSQEQTQNYPVIQPRDIYKTFRIAITNSESGPEIKLLLMLLKNAKIRDRLKLATGKT